MQICYYNACLDLGRTEDVNEMAEDFNNKVKEALDVCASWKNVKICQYYKSGISEETKQLFRQRDDLQKSIHKSPNEKKMPHLETIKL